MAQAMSDLLGQLEPEIQDPEEGTTFFLRTEAFLLFAQSIPSQNLGFIDSKATTLELTINGQDLTITQSPAVLSSNRSGGTTGAVVWKVTPLFAAWLASPTANVLFRTGALGLASTVLELGCGVSALVGLATAPLVARYVLTDQPYVARFVEQNIAQNNNTTAVRSALGKTKPGKSSSSSSSSRRGTKPSSSSSASAAASGKPARLVFQPLDWELDVPTHALAVPDVVVACDCIYNDALIPPFVQTCVDACRLRPEKDEKDDGNDAAGGEDSRPCLCIVAQQLRDPEIFEGWLKEFMRKGFRVWRVPDEELPEGLRSSSGFVVHVGILRESFERS